jgi:preprotein translocase subunit SecG
MLTFLLVIAIIVSILLMLVVLVQNPKGGGIASNFSAGNQFLGVAKTTDIIEKITWGFAILIIVISLLTSSYNRPSDDLSDMPEADTDIEQLLEDRPNVTIPQTPVDPADGAENNSDQATSEEGE